MSFHQDGIIRDLKFHSAFKQSCITSAATDAAARIAIRERERQEAILKQEQEERRKKAAAAPAAEKTRKATRAELERALEAEMAAFDAEYQRVATLSSGTSVSAVAGSELLKKK